jgi:hypothetical protein
MANELNIALSTGLTVTAQRYQSGAAVGAAISCAEVGSTGFYSGNMTGAAGAYQLAFIAAGANVGSGSIVWDGTAEVASSAPTAAAIASQVRTELSTELGRIDAAVSSRLAPNGTLATVTTLTNAPTVPTPAQIASQVRTELGTELGRIDAAVSSRLSTAGYTAPTTPPTAVQNATAVRAELATELGRVDAAVSTRATPANIPTADISAIKAKTDALNVDRVNNTATTAIVGNLLAQANS